MQHNIPANPVQLDLITAMRITAGGSMFNERTLMSRPDVWHRVKILRGGRYEKDFILKLVINAVEPADLIPVRYQASGDDSTFIARNCGPALEKLCRSKLTVEIPHGEPLSLLITLGFASIHDIKVNMQALLMAALQRRYDPKKKTLQLDNFHKDKEMSKTVYCPLSQQRTFSYVLKVAKNTLSHFEHLNLQRNELFNLSSIESTNLGPSLKSIDLRHNNLMGMEALMPLRSLDIFEIWLDGNPVCENYSDPEQYIETARKYCSRLTRLDGVYIGAPGMPLTYNSYFQSAEKKKLATQFVHHFFNLYDQKDRSVLSGLYHDEALYSLTLGIPPALASKKNLHNFMADNRNLAKLADLSKSHDMIYRGAENILAALKKLPQSYHDRNSFRCDLIYDDSNTFVISIQGIFKDWTATLKTLSFNRTFLLVVGDDDEYKIMNDQYHVDFAPIGQLTDILPDNHADVELSTTCFSPREKTGMIEKLRNVTTMNRESCHLYLEEANWDLRKAIIHFMDKYRTRNVPPEAFYQ